MSQDVLRCLAVLTITVAGLSLAPAVADLPEPAQPGERAACPVCGMLVAPHPSWIAQVLFEDGSARFFDGAKDLFRYLLAREEYAAEKRHLEIAAVFVTSY